MEKTFTRAGVSTNNGKTQFRFTNDLQRETVLSKNGHTDIVFYELGSAMSKAAATEFLTAQGLVEAAAVPVKLARASRNPVQDTDSFVEPKDERVQVAMSRLARQYPGMSAENLLKQVQMTFKEFGDYEPNF